MKKFNVECLEQNLELAKELLENSYSMKPSRNKDGTFMVINAQFKELCTEDAANNIIWCKRNGAIIPGVLPKQLKEAVQKVVNENSSAEAKKKVDNIKDFIEDIFDVPKLASLECDYADERLRIIVDGTCVGSISSASSRNLDWAKHIFDKINFRQQAEDLIEGTPLAIQTFSMSSDFAISGTDLNTHCITTDDERQAFLRKVKSAIEKSGEIGENQRWAQEKLDTLGIEYELTVGATTYSISAQVEGAYIYKRDDAIRNMKSVINRFISQVEKVSA
jgi:predicted metal-dependent hydrolase